MIQKKLNKKTLVLLALLSQVGPYPRRSEKIKRTKIQIKINRLLAAKNIKDELNIREKFLYKALKDFWIQDLKKRRQLKSMGLIIDLQKIINKTYKKNLNKGGSNDNINKGGNII